MNQRSFRAVWEAELDRLELDVIRVERMLSGTGTPPAQPWSPPAVPGPIPLDLVPRARDLLDRQERTTRRLHDSLTSAQKQIAYGSRVSDATAPGPSIPVYVDLEA